MSSKTKIVVLHLKELIYTGIFIALGILFVILIIIMFLPDGKKNPNTAVPASTYIPGVYTTSLTLNDNTIDIEVVVDENNINSIRLVNLDEAVTTMYPLIEPSFQDLVNQICENQSFDGITYSDDNKYTSMVLLDAIQASLTKAQILPPPSSESN
ncbi:MAG: hypothetical protein RRX92_05165 [Lachnospiraceae bacterium]